MQNNTTKKWLMGILGIIVFALVTIGFDKYTQYNFYKKIEASAQQEIRSMDDPYLDGINAKFINNNTTMVYEYSAKYPEVYQTMQERELEYINEVLNHSCPNLELAFTKGIDAEFHYYFNDLTTPFLIVKANPVTCGLGR